MSLRQWAAWVAIATTLAVCTTASAEKRPYVPRWQGPYEGPVEEDNRDILGLAFLGSGVVATGFGLYFLDATSSVRCHPASATEGGNNGTPERTVCEETGGDRIELGAGLLIGGVFLAGFGVYLFASSIPAPMGLDGGDAPELIRMEVVVAPAPGGAVVVGDVRF